MKKTKLLTALLLCTAVSLNAQGIAATHNTNVSEIVNKTYDGYVTQGNGGAISNSISSVIKESTFTNNRAESNGAGGALDLNTKSDMLTQIINSHFDNNYSNYEGGAVAQRRNSGSLEISGGSYTNNSAEYEGGALFLGSNANVTSSIDKVIFEGNKTLSKTFNDKYSTADDGGGGAIFVGSKAHVNVSNSEFKSNISNTVGGAIAVRNDSVNDGSNSLTVTNSTFTGNEALKDGGAIASYIDFNVSNTTFEGNTAGRYGGAVSLDIGNPNAKASQGSVFNNVTFNNNSAYIGGAMNVTKGANADIISSTFTGNKADFYGAISNGVNGGLVNITDTTISNNEAKAGGAIGNFAGKNPNSGMVIKNSKFLANKATDSNDDGGGAILLGAESKTTIQNTTFKGNDSKTIGGAIATRSGKVAHNDGASLDITGSTFENNTATKNGGAIYNSFYNSEANSGAVTLSANNFINNKAGNMGGAIFTEAGTDKNGGSASMLVDGSNFTGNNAGWGGAIAHASNGIMDIKNSTFDNNTATHQGGAILSLRNNADKDAIVLNIENAVFNKNEATEEGGAVWSGSKTTIANSIFDGNKTTGTTLSETPNFNTDDEGGGAVFVGSNSVTSIAGSTFTNNQSGTVGGAIATRSNAKNDGTTSLDITSSNFEGNKAAVNGGAIATYIDATITDTNFTNNTAGSKGGAVWANQDLTVNAVNSNVVMTGNKASEGGDIFMNKEGANLNMNAAEDKSITVASGISGNNYNMNVNAGEGATGSLILDSAVQNATIAVNAGTFQLGQNATLVDSHLTMATGSTFNSINGRIDTPEMIAKGDSSVTFADGTNIAADVNIANGTADNFTGADIQGKVILTEIKTLGNTTANGVSINLAEAMGIDPNNMAISEALQNQTQRILTPIRYLQGGISENGMLTMAPTGNGYKDFNPAVMASPVAAQLGGYLTQLNSYDQAFRNMDMYMLMTKKQREAMKLRNKYAAADSNLIFDPTGSAYDDKAVWVRPYATFENVPLKNGPKVSNVAYGSFFGAESELYDLGNGWDGMYGVYAGYNGSHQAYDGIGIYQNGGTLGLVGMAYKGNFFTGLTVNAGANVGEANTAYGTDNFTMLMAGIANKTGYNIELADGKFIIQPNVQLSYSFVNTFDYTNSAGVHMSSDPLNAIQVEPGVKFIGNLKNGWQPYAGVSVVWNIMDKTNFNANNVSLPELSVKPYVRYGLGVRKTWGEVCTGFLQTYFTNGGRNGVGFQAGFRFTLGKGGLGSLKTSNMPELPATKIMLSNGGR